MGVKDSQQLRKKNFVKKITVGQIFGVGLPLVDREGGLHTSSFAMSTKTIFDQRVKTITRELDQPSTMSLEIRESPEVA